MTRAEWRICVDWDGGRRLRRAGRGRDGGRAGSDARPQPGPADGAYPCGAGGDGAAQWRPQVQPAQRQVAADGQREAGAQAVGARGLPVRRFFQYAGHATCDTRAGLRRRVCVDGARRRVRDWPRWRRRAYQPCRWRGALRRDARLRRRERFVRVRFHARRRYDARRPLLPLLGRRQLPVRPGQGLGCGGAEGGGRRGWSAGVGRPRVGSWGPGLPPGRAARRLDTGLRGTRRGGGGGVVVQRGGDEARAVLGGPGRSRGGRASAAGCRCSTGASTRFCRGLAAGRGTATCGRWTRWSG